MLSKKATSNLTKEGFSANIVLTKHRGAKMKVLVRKVDYHNLHNIIDTQQEKIDGLEKDKLDLFTGYTVLIKTIQEQKEEIAQLKGENNGN